MTSISRLARGTLLYGVGQALGRSLTLLLVPVLTRFFEPAAYGILSVLTAFGLLLATVFSLGLGAAMAPSYFAAQTAEGKGATVWSSLALLLCSTAIMFLAALVGSRQISAALFGDPLYSRWVLLAVGATAFSVLSTPFRQCLMFEERARLYVLVSTISVLGTLLLTIWMVAILRRGVGGVLEADLLGQFATLLLFVGPALRDAPIRVRRQHVRELVLLGLPLIPAFAALFILQYGSRHMLQWLRGSVEVGVYTVGVNLGSAVGLFVSGFQSAWMPYFMSFQGLPRKAQFVFGRVCTYYVLAVGAVSLLVYVFARPAVMIVAAPAYHGAATVVGLAGTSQLLSGLFLVLLPGIYFAKEVQYLGLMQAAAALICVVLNLVLVPSFGYIGSALAVVFSYCALVIFQQLWNRQRAYLEIQYERARLRSFGMIYVTIAALTLIPRDFGILQELLVSVMMTGVLAVVVWRLLDADERLRLRCWIFGGNRAKQLNGQ